LTHRRIFTHAGRPLGANRRSFQTRDKHLYPTSLLLPCLRLTGRFSTELSIISTI